MYTRSSCEVDAGLQRRKLYFDDCSLPFELTIGDIDDLIDTFTRNFDAASKILSKKKPQPLDYIELEKRYQQCLRMIGLTLQILK